MHTTTLTTEQQARSDSPIAHALRGRISAWTERNILATVAYTCAIRAAYAGAIAERASGQPTAAEIEAERHNHAATAAAGAVLGLASALAYYIAHGGRPIVTIDSKPPGDDATPLRRACYAALEEASRDVVEAVAWVESHARSAEAAA